MSHGALGFAQHGAVGGFVMGSAMWGWAAMQQQAMPPTAASSRAEALVHDLIHQDCRVTAHPAQVCFGDAGGLGCKNQLWSLQHLPKHYLQAQLQAQQEFLTPKNFSREGWGIPGRVGPVWFRPHCLHCLAKAVGSVNPYHLQLFSSLLRPSPG